MNKSSSVNGVFITTTSLLTKPTNGSTKQFLIPFKLRKLIKSSPNFKAFCLTALSLGNSVCLVVYLNNFKPRLLTTSSILLSSIEPIKLLFSLSEFKVVLELYF